jgi:hypothetical protein
MSGAAKWQSSALGRILSKKRRFIFEGGYNKVHGIVCKVHECICLEPASPDLCHASAIQSKDLNFVEPKSEMGSYRV